MIAWNLEKKLKLSQELPEYEENKSWNLDKCKWKTAESFETAWIVEKFGISRESNQKNGTILKMRPKTFNELCKLIGLVETIKTQNKTIYNWLSRPEGIRIGFIDVPV